MLKFEINNDGIDCDIVSRYCKEAFEKFVDSLSEQDLTMFAAYVGNFSELHLRPEIDLVEALKGSAVAYQFWQTYIVLTRVERKSLVALGETIARAIRSEIRKGT